MLYKNKINYVADGIMTYITACKNQHHADELELLIKLRELISHKINNLEALDPARNWPTR